MITRVQKIFAYATITSVMLCIIIMLILSNCLLSAYLYPMHSEEVDSMYINSLWIYMSLFAFIIVLLLLDWKYKIILVIYTLIVILIMLSFAL